MGAAGAGIARGSGAAAGLRINNSFGAVSRTLLRSRESLRTFGPGPEISVESITYRSRAKRRSLRANDTSRPTPCEVDGRPFRHHPIVEIFNNGVDLPMATVNFSVPDDIKAEFDRVFGAQNKSAVIADLMRRAVAEVKQRKRREDIFRLLTQRRQQRPSLTDEQIRRSRMSGRP